MWLYCLAPTGPTGQAPSYLSDEDNDDRVLLLLLRELRDEGAEGVRKVGMHLPLYAGDSHHDRHCPGPRRDFRKRPLRTRCSSQLP